MVRKRALAGIALLAVAVAAGVAVRWWRDDAVLRTVPLSAVALAVDEQDGYVVAAGDAGPCCARSSRGRLSVLDARSGTILRGVALSSPGGWSRLALDGRLGRAYVAMLDYYGRPGRVDVVDLRRGRLLRTISPCPPAVALAVDARAGRLLVVGGAGGGLWAAGSLSVVDARSGAVLHRYPLGERSGGVAVDEASGLAFVASQQTNSFGIAVGRGRVDMLATARGRLLHSIAVPQNPILALASAATGRVYVLSQGADQAPDHGYVTTLDARTGRVLRSSKVGRYVTDMALDAETNRLFVMDPGDWPGQGSIAVLDARSGRLLRSVALPDEPQGIVVDARHDRVFVAGQHRDSQGNYAGPGSVAVLDASSGRILRSVHVGTNPSALDLDERSARLFVATIGPLAPQSTDFPIATQMGSVSVLDARSGAVLRTFSVGAIPSAIAVDERTGRAFVLNAGGTLMDSGGQGAWRWLPAWLRRRLPFLAPRPRTSAVAGSISVLDATR